MVLRKIAHACAGMMVVLLAAEAFAACAGTILGRITDESGNPVAGATISITSPEDPSVKVSVATDADGRYSVPVPEIRLLFLIRAEKEGFTASQTSMKVSKGKEFTADMTLHPPIAPPPPKVEPGVQAYNDGVVLYQKGERDGAAKAFQQAVTLKPDLKPAWKVLAQMAFERKDYANALTDARKVVELDPKDTELLQILMVASRETNDPAAADYRKRYYDANADSPDVNYNFGVEAYNAKDYTGASAYFSKATQIKPDLAVAYFWLGMTQYNMKNFGTAKASFQKYLQLDPNGSQAAAAKQMIAVLSAQ